MSFTQIHRENRVLLSLQQRGREGEKKQRQTDAALHAKVSSSTEPRVVSGL